MPPEPIRSRTRKRSITNSATTTNILRRSAVLSCRASRAAAGFILRPPKGLPVAFLDEDELQESGSLTSGAERQRQLLVRRVIALVVGVLIIVLLLLAV